MEDDGRELLPERAEQRLDRGAALRAEHDLLDRDLAGEARGRQRGDHRRRRDEEERDPEPALPHDERGALPRMPGERQERAHRNAAARAPRTASSVA